MAPQSAPEDHWQRLESLFHAALEMDPGRWCDFLDEACQNDPDLRSDVDSLLKSADQTLTSLRKPVDQAAAEITGDAPFIGTRIGPYEVISLLGEGGMGKVFLAARADEQYRQKVAIKLMHGWFGSRPAMLLRFRAERQILANLDHPNIARLLDGGMTGDGSPYLVMEYVEGTPIDDYCGLHALSTKQRLQLFQSVCAAVDYAHHNLVIHRDIKPANILVTPQGVPKLLDFGIAKLLDPGEAEQEQPMTRPTERLMTPEYASPEQIRGEAVTTATDVYGLGVLLYELLAGQRPFTVDAKNPFEVVRVVCEDDPEPPSTAYRANPASAPPDAGKLTSDLDNIVRMAMRKEPGRRYPSAVQLSADIQSYLDGYPLVARTDNWSYRADKFVRRHKGAVATGAVFALALVGFSIGMALLARQANREQIIARQESDFLAGMFRAAKPDSSRGRTVTARELLDLGAKRIDAVSTMDPVVRASLLDNIAGAYRTLGLYDEAIPIAQRSYDLKSRLYGVDNPQVAASTDLLASLHRDKAEYQQAEPLFRKALAIRRRNPGPNDALLAVALSNLGECLYQEDKDREAEGLLREALAIDRRHETEITGGVRNYLALLLERKGEYGEAGSLLREAVDINRRREGPDSPNYSLSLHNLSGALIDAGDLSGAESKLRETLAIRRKIFGNTHPELIYTLNNLGFVLLEKGQAAEAEPYIREAIALGTQQLGERHPLTATARNNLARILQAEGDYAGAEKEFRQSLAIVWKPDDPPNTRAAGILTNLGLLEFDRGNYSAAEALARQSLEMRRKLGGEDTPAVASSLMDVAEDRVFQRDAAAAEPMLREALEIRRHKYSATYPALIRAEVRLGEALIAEGKASTAEPVLREAVNSSRSAPFPLLPWQIAEAESALGACLKDLGRTAEALPLLAESKSNLRTNPRPAFRQPADERLGRH